MHPGQDCGTSTIGYGLMVSMSMAMETEINDARSIRDASASEKMKEGQPSSSLGKK